MVTVTVFAYDLSHGMARQMSMAWTGRMFEAIWHTSIVYNNEIEAYFGQGITTCRPGTTQYGTPLRKIDMGTSGIDKETFLEYIEGLREVWKADAYHLLDMNCNNFTNEVTTFLTGKSIPQDILDLPKEFLATPLGSSLRPMIDQMFRGGPAPASNGYMGGSDPTSALNQVASSAFSSQPSTFGTRSDINSVTSPLTICTNSSNFNNLLQSHVCVVANFTNESGCPPCRAIAPTFESLAQQSVSERSKSEFGRSKSVRDIVFVKIDSQMGAELMSRFGVRATPTFKFFINGKEVGEVKGANHSELKSQVDLTLFTAYPPHEHLKLKLPHLSTLRPDCIRYSQTPNFTAVGSRIETALDSATKANVTSNITECRSIFREKVIPHLQAQAKPSNSPIFGQWAQATLTATQVLQPTELFPVIDLFRLGVLQPEFCQVLAALQPNEASHPLLAILSKASKVEKLNRPFALTTLRLLSNSLTSQPLSSLMMSQVHRANLTNLVVTALLAEEEDVKTTGGSLAWGLVSWWVSGRTTWKDHERGESTNDEDEDWEVELATALIETLSKNNSVDVVVRIITTLGLLLYLSPYYDSALKPLTDALDLATTLKDKMQLVTVKNDVDVAKDVVLLCH